MASFIHRDSTQTHQRLIGSRQLGSVSFTIMGMLQLALLMNMLLAPSAHAAPQTDEAQQAASNFFLEYMALGQQNKVIGLPSMQQLDTLSPHLIPKLHRIFYIALREQYRCHGRGKTTPWDGGDIFSSSDSGFNTFSVSPSITNQFGRQAKVSFTAQQNGKTLRWDDEVILRKENGAWLIYDIEYHGQFARSKRGKSLQSVIDKNPAC